MLKRAIKLEKTIEFILAQQARFSSDLVALRNEFSYQLTAQRTCKLSSWWVAGIALSSLLGLMGNPPKKAANRCRINAINVCSSLRVVHK